jgi:hypothetical protein
MFKLNTTKEIFYIFLWLIGIIAFYALVHTYILESKSDTSSAHKTNHVSNKVVAAQTVLAHASEDKTIIVPIKTEKITTPIHTSNNKVVPVDLTNDVSIAVKDTKKIPKVSKTKIVPKKEKENLNEVAHVASAPIDIAKAKKEVVISKQKIDTNIVTKVEAIAVVEEKHNPKISTPSIPSIPSVVTAISVPSVPVAPSVPSTPSIVKDDTKKINGSDESKNKDLDLQIEKLTHELSIDDKMKLIESAHQLVIEKAEASIKTIK